MSEYIERKALEIELNHRLSFLMAENGEYDSYTSGFNEAVTRVEVFPSADVAAVVHGKWVYDKNGMDFNLGAWVCSECGKRHLVIYQEGLIFGNKNKYCEQCGQAIDWEGYRDENQPCE